MDICFVRMYAEMWVQINPTVTWKPSKASKQHLHAQLKKKKERKKRFFVCVVSQNILQILSLTSKASYHIQRS